MWAIEIFAEGLVGGILRPGGARECSFFKGRGSCPLTLEPTPPRILLRSRKKALPSTWA